VPEPAAHSPAETAYNYPDKNRWYPVLYYAVGEVVAGEGPIHLVEPFPTARVDGSDGLAPIEEEGGACVAVVCQDAAPRPRGSEADGDWILPGKALRESCAYDARVQNQAELTDAWREASAIAATLNTGLEDVTGVDLRAEDIEVLLAAERGLLTGDSRFPDTINEMRFTKPGDSHHAERLSGPQRRRVRDRLGLVEAGQTRPRQAGRPELSTGGTGWTETVYQLTAAGYMVLAAIRRHGVEPEQRDGLAMRPNLPPDQGLVTEGGALTIIDAGAARLGPDGFTIAESQTPWTDAGSGDDAAAQVQMYLRLAAAVEDGYAEIVGEPDDDGHQLLKITPAGIARLERSRSKP